MVRNDGRILPVLVNSRQKRGGDGAPLFNRITLFDATERRRYERELLLARRKAEQVAKDKSDLLAMLSHDIRNPLNALMGVVQLPDRGDLSDSQHRFVRLLKSSSENMLNLLNQVLELSKAESSTFALAEIPFSLQAVVYDVVSTFDAAAREKGLQLRSSITDTVPSVVIGDPVATRQILTNLIGNAVKFTSAGSVTLTVETKQISNRHGDTRIRRSRYWHRHSGGGDRPHLRRVYAGKLRDRDEIWWDRPRAHHHQTAARAVRQRGTSAQHAR